MKVKKLLAAVLAAAMTLTMGFSAFAQNKAYTGSDGDGATITITNAAKGETYKVYKVFDATVYTSSEPNSIAYQGTVPQSLADYFEQIGDTGYVKVKAGISESDLFDALKTWAEGQSELIKETSDGSDLVFTNLPYGYYVVTSTQQNGAVVTVDSTFPNATIVDKNVTPPVNNLQKKASPTDAFIGETITYEVSFDTANYYRTPSDATDAEPEQIVSYTISDTPAAGSLDDITVTGIKVVGKDGSETALAVQQFAGGKITINWTDNAGQAGTSLYDNGAKLVITYTGVVADTAAIDGAGNTNEVSVTFKTDKGTEPGPDEYTTDATFYTYAFAIKKVGQAGQDLAGAEFELPFYVQAAAADDGAYIYAGTEAGEGLVNKLTTPASGLLIIKGVKSGTYSLTETKAPDGFNRLTEPVEAEAVKTGETTTETTTYLDKDGNIVDEETQEGSTVLVTIEELAATPVVIVNKTGAELPATGGMGTTIFYIIGSILVIGAGIVLVAKRRMHV